jgi:hypothetical protein
MLETILLKAIVKQKHSNHKLFATSDTMEKSDKCGERMPLTARCLDIQKRKSVVLSL